MNDNHINAIVLEAAYQQTRTIQNWDRLAWLMDYAPEGYTARLILMAALQLPRLSAHE